MDKEKLVQALLLEIDAMQAKLTAMKQQLNLLEVTMQADAAALKASELRIKQLELLVNVTPAVEVVDTQEKEVVETVEVEVEKEVAAPEKVAPVEVKEASQTASVRSEVKDARLITDLRKAIGLNDRFRFKNDLFGNNESLLLDTIDALNDLQSMGEADAYLKARFQWNADDATVIYFYELLERKYYRP